MRRFKDQMPRGVMGLLKLLIVLAVLWSIHRTLLSAFDQLGKQDVSFSPWWLSLSGILYLLGLAPAAWFWHRVLVRLGQPPRWFDSVRAFYVSQLGKYVPGKAMVIVLRTALVRGAGVNTAVAVISVFVETLGVMAVGGLVSALILLVMLPDPWPLALAGFTCAVASTLPTVPWVFSRLARLGFGRFDPQAATWLAQLDFRTLCTGWLMLALGWVIMGLSLVATVRGLGVISFGTWRDLGFSTAAVALAVAAGFFLLIPGGAVVRESVLIQLLAPIIGDLPALASAVVLRIVSMVSELAISAILYTIGRRESPRPKLSEESRRPSD